MSMLGWPADKVLRMRGPGIRSTVMGKDRHNNLIVKWFYAETTLTMRYQKKGRVTCYRVAKEEPT